MIDRLEIAIAILSNLLPQSNQSKFINKSDRWWSIPSGLFSDKSNGFFEKNNPTLQKLNIKSDRNQNI